MKATLLAAAASAIATSGVLFILAAAPAPMPALGDIGRQVARAGDAIAVTANRTDDVPVPVPVPGTRSCRGAC